MLDRQNKGREGEEIAKDFLEGSGFKILEERFRCRLGEIDLIAEKKKELYFIEVKARWSLNCGNPLEAITFAKQKQIVNTAKHYLLVKRLPNVYCHLSALGVDMSGEKPEVEFIEDAFEA